MKRIIYFVDNDSRFAHFHGGIAEWIAREE